MQQEQIIQSLNRRYATKTFDPSKKIDDATMHTLLESLRLAPSSFGLQPRWFVRVVNPTVRQQLREHARGQSQITDASDMIVLCRKTTIDESLVQQYINDIVTTRGVSEEDLHGFKNMMLGFLEQRDPERLAQRAHKQCYIAMGFLLETAALLQVDTCPMEGFNPAKFDEILWLAALWLASVATVTLWYRSDDDSFASMAKVRFDSKSIIHTV
jgi:nitroreductase